MAMNFKLVYTNKDGAAIADAFAAAYNYQETIDDGEGNQIPNPVSKWNFVSDKVADYVGEITLAHLMKLEQEKVIEPPRPKPTDKTTT